MSQVLRLRAGGSGVTGHPVGCRGATPPSVLLKAYDQIGDEIVVTEKVARETPDASLENYCRGKISGLVAARNLLADAVENALEQRT